MVKHRWNRFPDGRSPMAKHERSPIKRVNLITIVLLTLSVKRFNSCFANSPISVNINDDLQSWLNDDDDIITEATFPDNFRCIISGPSECGKTFLLKKLFPASIYFD